MGVCYTCKARGLGYADEVEMWTDLRLKKRKSLEVLGKLCGVTDAAVSHRLCLLGLDDVSQHWRAKRKKEV